MCDLAAWDVPPEMHLLNVPPEMHLLESSGIAASERTEGAGDTSQESPQLPGRPLRSPKPSAKVREALNSFENNVRTTRRTSGIVAQPDSAPVLDGRTSVAQRLMAEVGSSRRDIEELKDIIKRQTDTLSTELALVKIKLASVEAELSDTKKRADEEQKRMYEERKRMAEEQKRMAEEQKRMAEEQKRMAEKQEQIVGELKQIHARRAKDQSKAALDNVSEIEQRIKLAIQTVEALEEVEITGIQVRGRNVRVLTPTEREAALLRTNDKWVNEIFEGARTRGEDWHPIKIDNVVKAVVVGEDGHTIKNSFAQMFYAENGVAGVIKSF
ncbi:hypothetical protein NEMBOFW57_009439 [Staphylotrichum longicolle]|uniref:Uncharacterized protein n=1 Tax=Staphylotrichum longicolle TaxID=669026 RepID=A0AAD4HTE9_9PEZI|nr:hypothetical protein NEMBOFW57_009439 [Staphylotrichum longicolle]